MTAAGVALADQFGRAWWMLRDVVNRFSDEEWRGGEDGKLSPARWALHTVEAVDFYLGDAPDDFKWPGRMGVDWEGAAVVDLPSQADLHTYIDDTEQRLDAFLRASPEELLFGENAFHWTGATPFERMLYVLRHTHSHIGDINMILRAEGVESGDWR